MRKRIYILILFISIISIISSCKKDEKFLTTKPLDEYSSVDFWNSPGLVETFVNGMYVDVFSFPYHFSGPGLSVYSGDEAWFSLGEGVSDFNKCIWTSDNIPGLVIGSEHYLDRLLWENGYKGVRKANILFSNIRKAKFDDPALKDRLTGEAYFLRGAYFNNLVSMYGGVPIVTKVYQLDDKFEVERNTYEECINFIVGQLDSAAVLLPESQSGINAGRATKGSALALKSRVLLYAASDLHHNISAYAPGYAKPELLGYVGANRASLWQKAKDAAKAVIDMGMYSLYKPDPAPGDSVAMNFIEYFLSRQATSEDIFIRFFTPKSSGDRWGDHDPYLFLFPNGYHGWGGVQPFAELVDAYERKDGTAVNWTDPVQAASPYSYRDARFYATILYEGSPWAVRPQDVRGIDPWNKIQTGTVNYIDGSGNANTLVGAEAGMVDDWSGIYTGYFLRKFLDPSVDYTSVKQNVPSRSIRYAEVLLNYAEACIELNQDAEARTYINMIRKRAGQPDITETGAALKARYRNERRIEMAFEDQYYFDVRRWMAGPSAYHPVHAHKIKYTTAQNITNYKKADGSTWSLPVFSTAVHDNYAWDNKAYYFPIFRDELNKNTKLVQNPGY